MGRSVPWPRPFRVSVPCAAAVAAVCGLLLASVGRAEDLKPADARLAQYLAANGSPQPLCATARGAFLWSLVRAFYAEREGLPAWLDREGGPGKAGRALLAALAAAEADGLDPARYDPARLAPGAEGSAVDAGLTAAFLLHASDLARGRPVPAGQPFWRLPTRDADLAALLAEAARSGHPESVLAGLRPTHPQYRALCEALARYRTLAARGVEPEPLPARSRLRPGARGPAVTALRARLWREGDLAAATAAGGDVFDAAAAEALKRFQARHGLAATGTLDPATVAALNVPAEERVRAIGLNLERWRWMAPPAARRSVLVNVPTFELHAYEDEREAFAMRVVTGEPGRPTPVFREDMTTVVFSPYWNVPPIIAATETLPLVLRDPGYVRRMGLEVLRGDEVVDPLRVNWRRDASRVTFRQRPGAGNALGRVKFLFPNPFNVYLHDTPQTALFARPRRAFSHGCVRVEQPARMAEWVLHGARGWTSARIRAAMGAGRESAVPLPDAIPVTVAYFTVWVDPDGTVQFRPDVYGHDRLQAGLLDAMDR